MRTELDKDRRLAWRAFFEAHARLMHQIDDDLERAGVGSLTDYDVLYVTYLQEGHRIRLAELAEAAFLSRSGLTRLVDRLERKGYLRREDCPNDRRGIYAVVTDEGIEELRRIWAVYSRGIAEYFGKHLSDEETELVRDIFSRIAGDLRLRRCVSVVAESAKDATGTAPEIAA